MSSCGQAAGRRYIIPAMPKIRFSSTEPEDTLIPPPNDIEDLIPHITNQGTDSEDEDDNAPPEAVTLHDGKSSIEAREVALHDFQLEFAFLSSAS
jgi:hypothetical protein